MAPQQKWNRKPPKLYTPEEVSDSGDPYSCLRTSIYFCTHRGFNNWYEEHLTKFFGEVTQVRRKKKKKALDMGSSVHDIVAAATSKGNGSAKNSVKKASKPLIERSNSSSKVRLPKKAKRQDSSSSVNRQSSRTRSKSPIKVKRNVSSAPAERAYKKQPKDASRKVKPRDELSFSAHPRLESSATSKSETKNAPDTMMSKSRKKQIKEFLPEKKLKLPAKKEMTEARKTNKKVQSSLPKEGKSVLVTSESCMQKLQEFLDKYNAESIHESHNTADTRDIVIAVKVLASKCVSPEVTVRLAQQHLVKKMLQLLKLQPIAPWTVYSILCLVNMLSFLLRSSTAKNKYFTINIIQTIFQVIGATTVASMLEDSDTSDSALKACMKLLASISQASEGDVKFSATLKTHGGLHALVLASQSKNEEASKQARLMLGKFKSDELNALISSTLLLASSDSASYISKNSSTITDLLKKNVNLELERRDFLEKRHKIALQRERRMATKAHEEIERRRKKQSEFINSVDAKSLQQRDKIKKRMEAIHAKDELKEEMERKKLKEEMDTRREALIRKRREIDDQQRRERQKARERKLMKQKEDLKLSMEKEKKK